MLMRMSDLLNSTRNVWHFLKCLKVQFRIFYIFLWHITKWSPIWGLFDDRKLFYIVKSLSIYRITSYWDENIRSYKDVMFIFIRYIWHCQWILWLTITKCAWSHNFLLALTFIISILGSQWEIGKRT